MSKRIRILFTAIVVIVAVGLLYWRYHEYLTNPWTRDGQVSANVIRVAPRVSGPLVELPIRDNQRVKTGDLLFRIDSRTYETNFEQAKAQLDRTKRDLIALDKQVVAAEAGVAQAAAAIKQAESDVVAKKSVLVESQKDLVRNARLLKQKLISQSQYDSILRDNQVNDASLKEADAALLAAQSRMRQAEAQLAVAEANRGTKGANNAQLRSAQANLETAKLNLGFTEVRASVDGMISNLDVRIGSQAVANQPFLALIDEKSFRIDAFFRETLVETFKPGDTAVVTLMSDPDNPLLGHVDSIGWGISKSDGSTGQNLLPQVSPTFQWIRLAQRIPVRILLDEIPQGISLRVGQTASVLVRTGGSKDTSKTAAPKALQ